MKFIYGKSKTDTGFKAMNINMGVRVKKLQYATRIPDNEVNEVLQQLQEDKPEWEFKIKRI